MQVVDNNTQLGSPVELPHAINEWAAIVAQILSNEPTGMERLYEKFAKGLRFYFCRHVGPDDHNDRVHDVFILAVLAIRQGELRDTDRLPGFVRTIAQRQVASHIDGQVRKRTREVRVEVGTDFNGCELNPEQQVLLKEKIGLAHRALRKLKVQDRELLTRFYLREQSATQICRELNLSEKQFRLRKSQAKAIFGLNGQRELTNVGLASHSQRATAA